MNRLFPKFAARCDLDRSPRSSKLAAPSIAGYKQHLFEKPKGGPFRRWNYNEKIKQSCNRAFPAPKGKELEAWRKQHAWAPNRLRHSRETYVREKYGLEASQAVLGHASADVTQIYDERNIEKTAKTMAEVG